MAARSAGGGLCRRRQAWREVVGRARGCTSAGWCWRWRRALDGGYRGCAKGQAARGWCEHPARRRGRPAPPRRRATRFSELRTQRKPWLRGSSAPSPAPTRGPGGHDRVLGCGDALPHRPPAVERKLRVVGGRQRVCRSGGTRTATSVSAGGSQGPRRRELRVVRRPTACLQESGWSAQRVWGEGEGEPATQHGPVLVCCSRVPASPAAPTAQLSPVPSKLSRWATPPSTLCSRHVQPLRARREPGGQAGHIGLRERRRRRRWQRCQPT